jgi:hypothetical protein
MRAFACRLESGDRRDLKDLGALRKNASLYRELDIGEKHILNQLRANGH